MQEGASELFCMFHGLFPKAVKKQWGETRSSLPLSRYMRGLSHGSGGMETHQAAPQSKREDACVSDISGAYCSAHKKTQIREQLTL